MKTRHLTLTFFVLLFTLTGRSQTKFDYMILCYSTEAKLITVSLNGQELIREPIDLPKSTKGVDNANPLLTKVLEYQEKSWEVVNFDFTTVATTYGQANTYFATLKKKTSESK